MLVPAGPMLLLRDTKMIPLNWKIRVIPTTFQDLYASESMSQGRNYSLGWGYDPHDQDVLVRPLQQWQQ